MRPIRPRRRSPEKAEQAAMVKLLRSLGAEVYVLGTRRKAGDYQGTCQTPGLPDLIAFLRGPTWPYDQWQRQILTVEVKATGGRLSAPQQDFARLCDAAQVAHVVGTADDLIGYLTESGYLRRKTG